MGTTSPDGFLYADSNHAMNNWWTAFQELADSIQAARTAERTWNSWTPTWNTPTDGGITSVGAGGTNEGWYRRDKGGQVDGYARIRLGTAPAFQSGTFVLILPVPMLALPSGEYQNQVVGTWGLRDDSTSPVQHIGGFLGCFMSVDGTKVHLGGASENTTPFDSRYRFDSTDPVALAVGDILSFNLHYRAAAP